jgi:hypothetical protein
VQEFALHLDTLADASHPYLIVGDYGLMAVDFLRYAVEKVKECCGIDSRANVCRVNGELLKLLYYGGTQNYFVQPQLLAALRSIREQKLAKLNLRVSQLARRSIAQIEQHSFDIAPFRTDLVAFYNRYSRQLRPPFWSRVFKRAIRLKVAPTVFGESYVIVARERLQLRKWQEGAQLLMWAIDCEGGGEQLFLKVLRFLTLEPAIGSMPSVYLPSLWRALGKWALSLGKYRRAVDCFNREKCCYDPLQLPPRELMVCLGIAYLGLNAWGQARPYLPYVANDYRNCPEMLKKVAMAHASLGNENLAKQFSLKADRLLALEPTQLCIEPASQIV